MKKRLYLNAFLVLFLVLGIVFWLAGCQDNSVKPETIPPSAPTNLVATAVDSTTVDLTWTASTDNIVVCWYNVYRRDCSTCSTGFIGTTRTTSFRDTTAFPGSAYEYSVQALDCSQNANLPPNPSDTTGTPGTPPGGSILLRSAASFGIFATAGVTNATGPSTVNGDIGITPGTAYVGFNNSVPSDPSGTHNGILYINDPGGVAAQAYQDWLTAYNNLFGRPCDVVSPSMNGTLTPAVYCFPSTAGLGTLILDGAGIYVFQVGSSLTTASNSSVTLINGATADNVFWVMGASATLGTGTDFQGTIIAGASITLNPGANIEDGRAAALQGQITINNSTITVP